jgi:hypothetical protein
MVNPRVSVLLLVEVPLAPLVCALSTRSRGLLLAGVLLTALAWASTARAVVALLVAVVLGPWTVAVSNRMVERDPPLTTTSPEAFCRNVSTTS